MKQRVRSRRLRCALLAAAGVLLVSCSRMPPRDGQPVGDFPRDPWVYKLKPTLVLSIPSSHHGVWARQKKPPRFPVDVERLPPTEQTGFVFFLPDFSGYTPDTVFRTFDEQRVLVTVAAATMEQALPGAVGDHVPNVRERLLGSLPDAKEHEMYGLSCHSRLPERASDRQVSCFGRSDPNATDVDIYVQASLLPSPWPYPQMSASYFTPRHGGLSVYWRTSAANLPQWREIDQQVRRFIESWNIAKGQ